MFILECGLNQMFFMLHASAMNAKFKILNIFQISYFSESISYPAWQCWIFSSVFMNVLIISCYTY